MIRTEHKIKMFGTEATVAVTTNAGRVVAVSPIRANERCEKLIAAVGRQVADGRALIDQHHNVVSLIDLLMALLTLEDAAWRDEHARPPTVSKPPLRLVKA